MKIQKIVAAIVIIFLGLLAPEYCFAGSKTFVSTDEDITIQLTDEYKDAQRAIKDNDLELDENVVNNIQTQMQNKNVVLYLVDSLDQDMSKQIMIVSGQNEVILQTPDLVTFRENKLNKYFERYINTLKQQNEIEEGCIKKFENNIYMAYKTTAENQQSYTYDTIVNHKAYSINISFTNNETTWEDADAIVKNLSIQFNNDSMDESTIAVLSSMIALITVVLLSIVKRYLKNKKENIPSEQEKEKFKKFGGILVLFVISLGFLILNRIVDIISIRTLVFADVSSILIIQELISLIMTFAISVIICIRKKSSPNKITKCLFINSIITEILMFLVSCMALASDTVFANSIYKYFINYSIKTALYTIIWINYFKFSKRVQAYYNVEDVTK